MKGQRKVYFSKNQYKATVQEFSIFLHCSVQGHSPGFQYVQYIQYMATVQDFSIFSTCSTRPQYKMSVFSVSAVQGHSTGVQYFQYLQYKATVQDFSIFSKNSVFFSICSPSIPYLTNKERGCCRAALIPRLCW